MKLTSRVLDASHRVVHELTATLFQKNGTSYSADHMFELPLASLKPDRYLFTMEATREPKQTARRDVVFSIR